MRRSFRHWLRPLLLALTLVILTTGCAASRAPVPVGVIPSPKPITMQEERYGHTVLMQLSQQWRLDYNHPKFETIQTIVNRLTTAAGSRGDPWHVYLFRDRTFKNAAATRGNHVFVWTGILESTKNDNELAAVLAHEIAHVISGHTDPDPNEELKKILISLGSAAAGAAVAGATQSPSMGNAAGRVTSGITQEVGSGILVYPYSRQLEHEADTVGLMLMAKAGYNPQGAIDFWKRAQKNPDFSSSVSFLSTHPAAENRLQQLQEALPLALRYYRGEPVNLPRSPSSNEQGYRERGLSERGYREPGRAARTWPEAPPSAPSPANDSFAIDPPTAPPAPEVDSFDLSQPRSEKTTWQVITPRAILFSEPRKSSHKLGEFRSGAVIYESSDHGDWIEILSPDRGFIAKEDIAPMSRPRPRERRYD